MLCRSCPHGNDRDSLGRKACRFHAPDKVWEVFLRAVAAARWIDKQIAAIDCIQPRLDLRNQCRIGLVGILLLRKPRIPWLSGNLGNAKLIGNVFGSRVATTDDPRNAHHRCNQCRLHSFAQDGSTRHKYRTFHGTIQTNTMIRGRLLSGFLLLMFAGMAFAGSRLAPPEEQPIVSPLVFIAAVLGGLVQFGSAVLSVTTVSSINHRQLGLALNGILFAIVAYPLGSTLIAITGGVFTIGAAITVGVALVLGGAVIATLRSHRTS